MNKNNRGALVFSISAGRQLVAGLALLSLAGCGSEDPKSELIGQASIELKLAPQGVQCITIQVQGSTTVVQQFTVTPTQSTTLALTGLPLGTDSFLAKAYPIACAQIGTTSPTYTSNTVQANVAVGTTPSVTLTMQAAQVTTGGAHVGVDFPTAGSTPNAVTLFNVPTANAALTAIVAGPDGNLWFVESSGNKIGRITPTGTITEFPLVNSNSSPDAITAGPDGNLWFTEENELTGRIGRITPTGVISEFTVSSPGDLYTQIVTGPDGNLWFTEYARNKVGRITTSGVLTEFNTANGAGPTGLAVGSDGNIWYAQYDASRIGRFTTIGASIDIGTTPHSPFALALGNDGNIWYAADSAVGRITTAGVITEFGVPGPAAPYLSVGPDGNLWFGGFGYLGRVTPTGSITQFPNGGAATEQAGGQAAGPDGNLWFTLPQSNKIGRLSL